MTDEIRQPAIFVSHGGGPCFWMNFPPPFGPGAFDRLRDYLAGMTARLPARPTAIVVVSAHWEEPVVTVSTAAAPPMLFDYFGFPPHTYQLSYPAPGSPEVAARIVGLFDQCGVEHEVNSRRGFDHGVFVPMLIIDPEARIPVVMVSIRHDLDPAKHIEIGRALASLRNENVMILGSGNIWHGPAHTALEGSPLFDGWIADRLTRDEPARRENVLIAWRHAPYSREAQPREDHLIPLMVVAGAAGSDVGRRSFADVIGGIVTTCYEFGQ